MRISIGHFITLLLLALFSHVAASAQTWQQVGRIPHRKYDDQVSAISFVDDTHGWASTAGGSISRSNDGGESWEKINGDSSLDLISALIFVNNRVGFYSGRSTHASHLWKTTDGGATWQAVFTDSSTSSHGAYFSIISFSIATPNVIYACGNSIILRTTDGGEQWNALPILRDPPIGFTAIWHSVSTINDHDVCVAGTSGGFRSSDGGVSWRNIKASGELASAQIIDDTTIYATSSQDFRKTTDGGETWSGITHNNQSDKFLPLIQLSFIDSRTGNLVTKDGIYSTRDGGSSFQFIPIYWHGSLYRLSTAPSGRAWVFSIDSGYVFRADAISGIDIAPAAGSFNADLRVAVEGGEYILHYRAGERDREAVVADLLGNTVTRLSLPAESGSSRISSTGLAAGIYFISVEGRTVPLVIAR
ncbi:MAG: YCF48-related protein [Candidatus Kapaibacterium sp.]